jgi:hypothetical protein
VGAGRTLRGEGGYKACITAVAGTEVLFSVNGSGVDISSLHLTLNDVAKGSSAFLLNNAQTELTDYFDAIADGNDIQRSKPAPDVFLVAAKKLSLSSDEAVIVEDAIAGVEAGRAAGMLTFALGDASKNKAADHNLEILSNILEYLP